MRFLFLPLCRACVWGVSEFARWQSLTLLIAAAGWLTPRAPFPRLAADGGWLTPSGVLVEAEQFDDGELAAAGRRVSVVYAATIAATGETYVSSGTEPFTFKVGGGMVVPGWDEGVRDMRVGGRRTLTIPARLGYGSGGSVGATGVQVPPEADLCIECELVGVSDGGLDTRWMGQLFSTQNLPLWGILLLTWAQIGVDYVTATR